MLRRIVVFGWKIKPRLNDSNISTQHIPTLLTQHLQAPEKRSQHLNATYCNIVGHNMLHAFGHHFATCCGLKIELACMPRCNIVGRTWPNDYNMQHPKMLHEKFDHFPIRNILQYVATRWSNARNLLHPTILRYVAMKCCDRLAGVFAYLSLCVCLLGSSVSSPILCKYV